MYHVTSNYHTKAGVWRAWVTLTTSHCDQVLFKKPKNLHHKHSNLLHKSRSSCVGKMATQIRNRG